MACNGEVSRKEKLLFEKNSFIYLFVFKVRIKTNEPTRKKVLVRFLGLEVNVGEMSAKIVS